MVKTGDFAHVSGTGSAIWKRIVSKVYIGERFKIPTPREAIEIWNS